MKNMSAEERTIFANKKIRNFSIIAHIDHGKSTLSDRLIEFTQAAPKRNMQEQMLDSLDIEKERGITVKSAAISLIYRSKKKTNGEHLLNLIDTPGHVDFNFEVKRSLGSCEGALLVVDASQGIQAQTLSNFYLALESNLHIIPVINKIDLPHADVEQTKRQLFEEFSFQEEEIICVSAKSGKNIEELLERIVEKIPAPADLGGDPLQALVFDSFYDTFRGVIICVRLFSGILKPGDKTKFFATGKTYVVEELGWLGVQRKKREQLKAGEVGYVILSIKSTTELKMGDTLTHQQHPCASALQGLSEVKAMIFAGVFPTESDKAAEFKVKLEKLALNDASLSYEVDNSAMLGLGFRCGFLGLLHLEITQERLSKEFSVETIITAPSVTYRFYLKNSKMQSINDPEKFPDPSLVERIEEPYIKVLIISPTTYLGSVMELVQMRRGEHGSLNYQKRSRVEAEFFVPLSEFIFDFYDKLKSLTRGYASLDYDFYDYRPAEVVKVDILVNKERVDALSFMVHHEKARQRSVKILKKLRDEIPKHMFLIPLQAAIGAKVIARETISALRKDVTSKCYGGDITRKRKLLEKQKEGKKRMKSVGSVDIPQKAFLSILKS